MDPQQMNQNNANMQQMPQPMRSNGDFVAPRPVDFKNMSSEEFAKWDAALSKRYR